MYEEYVTKRNQNTRTYCKQFFSGIKKTHGLCVIAERQKRMSFHLFLSIPMRHFMQINVGKKKKNNENDIIK